ncbi:MAG: hypothetical protein GY795_26290 [Desulfobacterales bacterium]|nr:hypothetical protein [Desulfobacterales bacterium]
MNKDFVTLVDESIKLELHVANLYSLFEKLFPEDAAFWWKLAFEEKNHAALIRSGKEHFEPFGKFPHDLLTPVLQELKDTNSRLETLIKKYEETSPPREEAFNVALMIENSAGELHFQEFINKEDNSAIHKIFTRLNADDKDHAKRISFYMEKHGIRLQSEGVPK